MNYKTTIILLYTLLFSVIGYGQLQEVEVSYKMETESYHRFIKCESEIYFLRRIKAKEVTQKDFLLSKYSDDGINELWETKIQLDQFQNVLNLTCINNHLQIFVIEHDLETKTTQLFIQQYDLYTGKRSLKKTLFISKVSEWKNVFGKAHVSQSFFSAMDSKQSEDEVTPLEYYFGLVFTLVDVVTCIFIMYCIFIPRLTQISQ